MRFFESTFVPHHAAHARYVSFVDEGKPEWLVSFTLQPDVDTSQASSVPEELDAPTDTARDDAAQPTTEPADDDVPPLPQESEPHPLLSPPPYALLHHQSARQGHRPGVEHGLRGFGGK